MIKGAPDGSEQSTVTELSERLQLAQSTVTELVRRAEETGLLKREQSSVDGRVAYLQLTEEGDRRLARRSRPTRKSARSSAPRSHTSSGSDSVAKIRRARGSALLPLLSGYDETAASPRPALRRTLRHRSRSPARRSREIADGRVVFSKTEAGRSRRGTGRTALGLTPLQQVPAELGRVARRRERSRPLARLALAAREVEIGVQLARLALVLVRRSTRPFDSNRPRKSTSASTRVCDGSRARSNTFSSIAAIGSIGAIWSTTSTRPPRPRHARELGDHELRPRRRGAASAASRPGRTRPLERRASSRRPRRS